MEQDSYSSRHGLKRQCDSEFWENARLVEGNRADEVLPRHQNGVAASTHDETLSTFIDGNTDVQSAKEAPSL